MNAERRKKLLLAAVLSQHACVMTLIASMYPSRRRVWVSKMLQERKTHGEYHTIVTDMMKFDTKAFVQSFRMDPTTMEELLRIVAPFLEKKSFREPVSPRERLLVTLRYLATGDDQKTVACSFRLGRSTVHNIIMETCEVIFSAVGKLYLKVPTEDEWLKIAKDFWKLWQFPNCIGAIDGKLIRIRPTSHSNDDIIMLIVGNSRYGITLLDVELDDDRVGGIFLHSAVGRGFEGNLHNVPSARKIEGNLASENPAIVQSRPTLPFVLVGNLSFPMRPYLMKPFSGKDLDKEKLVFNYRLSRVHDIVENILGILTVRWRFLLQLVYASTKTVDVMVKAACVLHNFLQSKEYEMPMAQRHYIPKNFVDREINGNIQPGEWRGELNSNKNAFDLLGRQSKFGSNNHTRESAVIRTEFSKFLSTEDGKIPWQDEKC